MVPEEEAYRKPDNQITRQPDRYQVFQRRMDGSEDFYRTWNEYRDGFGDVEREFWVGNEIIHKITSRAVYELRIDLEDFEGNTRYAMYSPFSLASEAEKYTLHIGLYNGDADLDLDLNPFTNCAVRFHGAWWYNSCHACNLNGLYLGGPTHTYAEGVTWDGWRGQYYSLKRTEMKIRPIIP
ncbi:ficolin-1-like [Gigantopelta aegis]|uniref:ficolin-1-like n=1 Tax=Gigantopelta aegis TaxID=1735272 RepID=UPI001B88E666|nr:ficolin-1-like [Gigantopelta aegis]